MDNPFTNWRQTLKITPRFRSTFPDIIYKLLVFFKLAIFDPPLKVKAKFCICWHSHLLNLKFLALELKGCLVYGWEVSKKLPTSFLICCSKAFCDEVWLDSASVGSWVIRFGWWRSLMRNAWRVEWNSRRTSACPCQSQSSVGAWSSAREPLRFWSFLF